MASMSMLVQSAVAGASEASADSATAMDGSTLPPPPQVHREAVELGANIEEVSDCIGGVGLGAPRVDDEVVNTIAVGIEMTYYCF